MNQQPDHVLVALCASLRHGSVIPLTAPPIEGRVLFKHSDDFGRNLIESQPVGGGRNSPACGALVELAKCMQGVPTLEGVAHANAAQKLFLRELPHLVADDTPIDVGIPPRLHQVDPRILSPFDRIGNGHNARSNAEPGSCNLRRY